MIVAILRATLAVAVAQVQGVAPPGATGVPAHGFPHSASPPDPLDGIGANPVICITMPRALFTLAFDYPTFRFEEVGHRRTR